MVSSLNGFKVSVNSLLCDGGKFIRWRRNHRRSRINKKWHKRYGMILFKCSGVCYEIKGMGLVMCPCTENQLKKEMAAGPVLTVPPTPSFLFDIC